MKVRRWSPGGSQAEKAKSMTKITTFSPDSPPTIDTKCKNFKKLSTLNYVNKLKNMKFFVKNTLILNNNLMQEANFLVALEGIPMKCKHNSCNIKI